MIPVMMMKRATCSASNQFSTNESQKGGKSEYLVKWAGFPEDDATWEPEDNLSCHDLIAEFERENKKEKSNKDELDSQESEDVDNKQLRCIVGLTKAPGELHFLCKFTDDTAMLLPAKEVNSRYPNHVIRFYESRLKLHDNYTTS
ncbi:unnamed protein product [Caenorhabditis angaria]|uniref:Chromo domain-containing protein n=1 Tax=Caenorhabditis angaria TaxID=860376 RepID=A0A9P1IDZ2_9PELO|nr:unnamed protein product [Caenorhabditis angaria]